MFTLLGRRLDPVDGHVSSFVATVHVRVKTVTFCLWMSCHSPCPRGLVTRIVGHVDGRSHSVFNFRFKCLALVTFGYFEGFSDHARETTRGRGFGKKATEADRSGSDSQLFHLIVLCNLPVVRSPCCHTALQPRRRPVPWGHYLAIASWEEPGQRAGSCMSRRLVTALVGRCSVNV